MSSFISNVLPYHQATSQLIISLANPPLLPMCLAWIFLAPTSSPRFFLLISIMFIVFKSQKSKGAIIFLGDLFATDTNYFIFYG